MVTTYYPAVRGTGGKARYMDIAEAEALMEHAGPSVNLPADKLAGTRTWSRTDALPLSGRRPLVLLSPGFTMPRHTMTALAEDLASRGYVAAAVDHAYESVATKFPGGVLPCSACELPGKIGIGKIALSRGADLSFVLDQLSRNPLVDRHHIAVVGHSMGGSGAATAMRADRRIDAGINMDGAMLPSDPLDRPFLLFGSPDLHVPGNEEYDPSWETVWPRMSGWKRWLTATTGSHYSFTDMTHLLRPADARDIHMTRSYVAAFVDQHLRGIPQRLLTGPSADFPEVGFDHP
ncbi:alpha/beta hydrolase family protein [Actinosynnema sp. ALI-1.44]|uniref:alpha/beta hydrolase family protein n=1 Tax=Actinosynnema sp. ALI-1.44 TaxID=1933779 RepID=UPI00143CD6FC|nr:alpha/beta hydrolase [Actinosynnema sp. ALI-1.44]